MARLLVVWRFHDLIIVGLFSTVFIVFTLIGYYFLILFLGNHILSFISILKSSSLIRLLQLSCILRWIFSIPFESNLSTKKLPNIWISKDADLNQSTSFLKPKIANALVFSKKACNLFFSNSLFRSCQGIQQYPHILFLLIPQVHLVLFCSYPL